MPDVLIRRVSQDVVDALDEKARAAGKDRQTWLLELLEQIAAQPVVKSRYIVKAFGPGASYAFIRRVDNTISDPREGQTNLTQAQRIAYEQALEYVKRNGPGDREEAHSLLSRHFETVFETLM